MLCFEKYYVFWNVSIFASSTCRNSVWTAVRFFFLQKKSMWHSQYAGTDVAEMIYFFLNFCSSIAPHHARLSHSYSRHKYFLHLCRIILSFWIPIMDKTPKIKFRKKRPYSWESFNSLILMPIYKPFLLALFSHFALRTLME